jgi:hypothetical protein
MAKRKRIYFFLRENIRHYFSGPPPWIMVDAAAMNDLPMNLPGDNRFLMANSANGSVMGIFEQTGLQRFDAVGAPYFEKDPGTPETSTIVGHYFTPFTQVIEGNRKFHTLPWRRVAEILGVHEDNWLSLRSMEITDEQFELLCAELVKVSAAPKPDLGEVVVVSVQDVTKNHSCIGECTGQSFEGFIREHHGDDLTGEQIENIAEQYNIGED